MCVVVIFLVKFGRWLIMFIEFYVIYEIFSEI